MIVIAVIAILWNFAIMASGSLIIKSRDSRRKADIQALRTAAQLYYSENGTYMFPGTGALGQGFGGNVNQGYGAIVSGTAVYPGLPITEFLTRQGYLQKSPMCDPTDGFPCYLNYLKNYYFVTCANGNLFSISATLEAPSAADRAHVRTVCGDRKSVV